MSSPNTLATEIVKLMQEHGDFTFNTPEPGNDPAVETTLDVDKGISVYGSTTAVVEFLLVVGFAAGSSGGGAHRFTQLMELAENARVNPDGDSIELVLPEFRADTQEG